MRDGFIIDIAINKSQGPDVSAGKGLKTAFLVCAGVSLVTKDWR
jgi:hypothetical protein